MRNIKGRVIETALPLERRYVYGGTPTPALPGKALRLKRRGAGRKVSTFNVILLLFGFGGAIVFYVNNILSINRLASEIGQLEARYQKIQGINVSLRTDVVRKSALDHISPVAHDQLGLHMLQTQQIWFSIDREKLRELGISSTDTQ
jgi:hypothetical protein